MILEIFEIDPKFPTNACIRLGQQRGGYKDEVYTSFVGRRTEATHITQDATPQHDDACMPVEHPGGQSVPDRHTCFKIFCFLTTRDNDNVILIAISLQQRITVFARIVIH
jgi:hypothetical protein